MKELLLNIRLEDLRHSGMPVQVFLSSGICLTGSVHDFDEEVIVLSCKDSKGKYSVFVTRSLVASFKIKIGDV
jgi:sRNA-binding regulator protein Hfq